MPRSDCCGIPLRGAVTVLGCALVVFCLGNGYTYGNMTPYLTSYLRNRSALSSDVRYADTLWISTGSILCSSFFMPILCMAEQYIPSRICILVGGWTFSLGIAVTYFSVSYSFVTTILSYGVLYAMGKSMAYPISLRMAIKWFPGRKGLVIGIIDACYGGSAFALNQIITRFINPDNLSPDQDINNNHYFTQDSLLDRVPYCFLLLGGIYAALSTVGVLLMKDPAVQVENGDAPGLKDTIQEIGDTGIKEDENRDERHDDDGSLSPMETLKTVRFYIIWLVYFSLGVSIDIFYGFYKPYGETFITDDYFLSLVASFAAIANALGNLFWGFMVDRYSYKPVLVSLITASGVFQATLIATEYGGKAMYFIWVCCLGFSMNGIFSILPLIAIEMFGNKYYSVNYGLVHTAGIAFGLVGATISSQSKDTLGWHGLFLLSAGISVISFLLSLILYFKNWTMEKKSSPI
ncbi:oxalate:formate antiporter-like [Haliotis rufescens]|uniref:oxalate:formate antiporter-like n=1 Tax=Haliotis rufescens TaxID=6454 RepID=UPI00201E7D87|nr:oxalate:formate antiporter-like [Haliotis rufescens]